MEHTGPIYGVELIDDLSMDGGMHQAMPSRSDLIGVRDHKQGQRVVAGYEVLLATWREQDEFIGRLKNTLLTNELAAPAWHDRPTVPGGWAWENKTVAHKGHGFIWLTQEDIDEWTPIEGDRMYGPIPQDPKENQ